MNSEYQNPSKQIDHHAVCARIAVSTIKKELNSMIKSEFVDAQYLDSLDSSLANLKQDILKEIRALEARRHGISLV